jgi:hypothetical protein
MQFLLNSAYPTLVRCPTTLADNLTSALRIHLFFAFLQTFITVCIRPMICHLQVGEHCATNGMQFLLAVRGCPQDNPTYTPVTPINVQCQAQLGQQGLAAAAGVLNSTLPGALGAAPGAAGAAAAPTRARSSAGVGRAAGVLAAAFGGAAAAAAVLL